MAISAAEQKTALASSLSAINHQSNLMKQCLADNNILQALKHCSNFLNELRTNQLSPKQYYELYIVVFDSLEALSSHLLGSHNAKQQKLERKQKLNNAENSSTSGAGNAIAANATAPFLADLYELVQYSGNIIPRLYMMIVIGTTYMSTKGAPTKEIMKDMIEMCHGVQHPIRGLFLRYYLSQRTKHLLPFGNANDFNDTVEFLIQNFIEMNKLWVRLQHQGHSSERELRYRERKELKILVGSNLVRLSQIIDDYDGDENYSSIKYYQEKVFPTITEQIIQCRDHLAQSYLIDVLVQIFPDDFHFATLNSLLNDVFINLHPLLKKSELVSTLIERFITYHKFESDMSSSKVVENESETKLGKLKLEDSEKDGDKNAEAAKDDEVDKREYESKSEENPSVDSASKPQKEESHKKIDITVLFNVFWQFYLKVFEMDPELPSDEHSVLLQSFIKLSLTYDPDNYQNLDTIYQFATEKLSTIKDEDTANQEDIWLQLLIVPIRHFKSIKTLFKLPFFHEFYLKLTNKQHQKQISLEIINKLLGVTQVLEENGATNQGEFEPEHFSTTDEVDGIFKYLLVLIKDSDKQLNTSKNLGITKTITLNKGETVISQEFLSNQEKVCKIIHLIENPQDPFKNLANLMYVRRKYLNKNFDNIIYTYPTLISRILYKLKIVGYALLRQQRKNKKQSVENNQDLLITSNFKNLSIIVDELYQYHAENNSELILKIYLNAASVADQLKQESISYELFTQCFVVYEENLILGSHNYIHHINPHDSVAGGSLPYQSIIYVANKLVTARYFNKENYENLITKLTLYGSKLLKKQDQCRSVYACAHLWWWCELLIEPTEKSPTVSSEEARKIKSVDNEKRESDNKAENVEHQDDAVTTEDEDEIELYRDAKRVLECLQRALRVADKCMDPYLSLQLFIEILNRCLIFNIYGNALVDSRYINGLIDLIRTNIDNLREDDTDLAAREKETENEEDDKEARLFRQSQGYFERTLGYIRDQQALENRFEGILV
ncbi:vacuolar protein sorting-associated protein 35 [Scheffersomyces xylosifermentans]|uniref:vacuolar protein sorting-associated protein 35 n=1 Tax=Scheffersomyces xylosifermentans TaxID=1304137 RepID=UPI00315DA212